MSGYHTVLMVEKIKAKAVAKNFTCDKLELQMPSAAWAKEFTELIVQECTGLLYEEAERLYTYSSECDNMRDSDEAELCAEKCMDNIKMIEKHFGVEE